MNLISEGLKFMDSTNNKFISPFVVGNRPVKVLGTLVGPGDFQWAVPPESQSQEAREIVEMIRTSYRPLQKEPAHTSQP